MSLKHGNDKKQEHRGLKELCELIGSCKLRNLSDVDIAKEIIKSYGFYITHLTYDEYLAWLRSDRRFAKIYFKVVAEESYANAMKAYDVIILNS